MYIHLLFPLSKQLARHSTATRKSRSSFTTFSLDSLAECTGGLTPVIRTLAPQEDQSLAKGGFSSTKLGCLRKMRRIAPNQGRKKVKHGGKLIAQRPREIIDFKAGQ